jgi:hypothetical protein
MTLSVEDSIAAAHRRFGVTKAITGPGALALTYGTPISTRGRTPQKVARAAQELYRSNSHVNDAERAVWTRAVNLPWHLEDANDDEVTDDSEPRLKAIRDLVERPQANLPREDIGYPMTRRTLWALTIRHMGLCGAAFWFADTVDPNTGLPLGFLYINPARLYSVLNRSAALIGWTLDRPMEEGGTPLALEQVVPFYLDPADTGYHGIGLVESLGLKSKLGELSDLYATNVIGAGGRLAGLLAPKVGSVVSDEQWKAFVNDWRNVTEDENSAKRLNIVKAPVDFTRTTGTPSEIGLVDLMRIAREDILAHWGVPPSQAAYEISGGLNSGNTKSFDEAVLYQGAVHNRVVPFWETLQYTVLDRAKDAGLVVELVIEEPEFDDDLPKFQLAEKSVNLPLTNKERRELIGLDPVGDDAIDNAILLPATIVEYANTTAPVEPPTVTVSPLPQLPPAFGTEIAPLKASLGDLRKVADRHVVPAQKALPRPSRHSGPRSPRASGAMPRPSRASPAT